MLRYKVFPIFAVVLVMGMLVTACGPVNLALQMADTARNKIEEQFSLPSAAQATPSPVEQASPPVNPPAVIGNWEAMQETLQQIYAKVNPSVVNIRVVSLAAAGNTLPFTLPGDPQQAPAQPLQEGEGSGFVWDKEGHIVTNNHVVENAQQVSVTFSDGFTVEGQVVGTDLNSDLAVVKVDVDANRLLPVQLVDSDLVQVGQLAVAIGNPFGLAGTQTVGFISALGRSLPVDSATLGGATYSIPDVIQTDAPINPGNSGGVLVNDLGQVIGVTAAIESPVRASAGIGFVIPSAIVQRVVPALIQSGHFDYAWLGISGTSLTAEIATQMDLNPDQRGILVGEVNPDGPAEKAGLRGSSREVNQNGGQLAVGGDVITAIDGKEVKSFDELVSYLVKRTSPGQTIQLTILRDGRESTIDVSLGTRPGSQQAAVELPNPTGTASLGITGITLTPAIAQEMDLPEDVQGVLIQEVLPGSAAEQANLRGGSQEASIDGQIILLGGDVITSFDGQSTASYEELRGLIARHQPGDEVSLTIQRGSQEIQLDVTLSERPVSNP